MKNMMCLFVMLLLYDGNKISYSPDKNLLLD